MSGSAHHTRVYVGEPVAGYGFGGGHPFGRDRHGAFWTEACRRRLDGRIARGELRAAMWNEMEAFHTRDYLEFAEAHCRAGIGFLDSGDTPAEPGVFEAAQHVAGATLNACEDVITGRCRRAFVPIGGLHHAARDRAAGFCVLNDIGIAVEMLRARHGVGRIAYVDIDAHHGDGVFYAYEDDPALIFADLHEDGRTLYPGTGSSDETGRGAAVGTKLNIPMPAGSGDDAFGAAWVQVEEHLGRHQPDFILLQCGADSLAGDPITHLRYSAEAHAHAARRLRVMADELCGGRLVAMGGGGYNRQNLAAAWCAVLEALAAED